MQKENEKHDLAEIKGKRGWPSAGAWREPSPRFSHDARYTTDRQTDRDRRVNCQTQTGRTGPVFGRRATYRNKCLAKERF